MEYMTNQKNIQSSPRKLRLVADMIRKMSPERALETLQFTNKAAALPLAKAIKTAVANAGKVENLAFKKLEINEGSKLKRYRPGTAGRGRGRPYKRRWSNIKVVLTDDVVQSSVEKQRMKKVAPVISNESERSQDSNLEISPSSRNDKEEKKVEVKE